MLKHKAYEDTHKKYPTQIIADEHAKGRAMFNLYIDKNKNKIQDLIKKQTIQTKKLKIEEFNDTYILPPRRIPDPSMPDMMLAGGVCDKNFKFIAGLTRDDNNKRLNFSITESYRLKDTEPVEHIESCIYGGFLIGLFGHCLVESLSRLWFINLDESLPKDIPIVFIRIHKVPPFFYKILELLKIENRVKVIEKPHFTKKIYIPEQANQIIRYVNEDYYNKIYETIKENIHIEEEPKKKIYLTRTQLPRKDCFGEEYFEHFFHENGYTVIAPEKIPLEKQIFYIAHADEIVCTLGTLSHASILFCKESAKLTYLIRDTEFAGILPQVILDKTKNCNTSYVDISYNFLPTTHARGVFLLSHSKYFDKYIEDNNINGNTSNKFQLKDFIVDYLNEYAINYCDYQYPYKRLKNLDYFDVISNISNVVLNKKLERKDFDTPNKLEIERRDRFFKGLSNFKSFNKEIITETNKAYRVLHCTYLQDKVAVNENEIEINIIIEQLHIHNEKINSNWKSLIPIFYAYYIADYKNFDLIVFDNKYKSIQLPQTIIDNFILSKYEIATNTIHLNKPIKQQFIECHGIHAWNIFQNSIDKDNEFKLISYIFDSQTYLFNDNVFIIKMDLFEEYFLRIEKIINKVFGELTKDKNTISNIAERLNTIYFYLKNIKEHSVLTFELPIKVQEENKEKTFLEKTKDILKFFK